MKEVLTVALTDSSSGLNKSRFCIRNDIANPNNGINLVLNRL